MKKILISKLVSSAIVETLDHHGYNVCHFDKAEGFSSELGYHADVSVGVLPNGLVTSRQFFEKNRAILDGENVVISKKTPSEIYPNDVFFNGAFVGETLIASKYICDEMSACAKKIITVKQGYAKCSCAIVGGSVITADNGIAEKLKENKIDHLKIDEGYIGLNGFSFGFIGGASFFDDGTLFTFGDVKKHKNGIDIVAFLKNIKVDVISLGKDELYDLGGAIILK